MKCYFFIIIHFDAEQIEKILFIIHLIRAKMTMFRQYSLLRLASDRTSLSPSIEAQSAATTPTACNHIEYAIDEKSAAQCDRLCCSKMEPVEFNRLL